MDRGGPPAGWSCRRTLFNYDVWLVIPPFLQFKQNRAERSLRERILWERRFVSSSFAIIISTNIIAESRAAGWKKKKRNNTIHNKKEWRWRGATSLWSLLDNQRSSKKTVSGIKNTLRHDPLAFQEIILASNCNHHLIQRR